MNLLLFEARELKLLTDSGQSVSAVVVADTLPGCSAGEPESSAAMPDFTVEAVLLRAETMTPVLREILHTCPPIHWGINEETYD